MAQPVAMMRQALQLLADGGQFRLTALSSLYLTEPQGGPEGQNWYHNAVALFHCDLSPLQALRRLLAVEAQLGRQRLERWGPRVIDLDFLAWGQLIVQEPELTAPHPRLPQRPFVLVPLAEVAPQWRHPLSGLSAQQMLAALNYNGQGLRRLAEGGLWLERDYA